MIPSPHRIAALVRTRVESATFWVPVWVWVVAFAAVVGASSAVIVTTGYARLQDRSPAVPIPSESGGDASK